MDDESSAGFHWAPGGQLRLRLKAQRHYFQPKQHQMSHRAAEKRSAGPAEARAAGGEVRSDGGPLHLYTSTPHPSYTLTVLPFCHCTVTLTGKECGRFGPAVQRSVDEICQTQIFQTSCVWTIVLFTVSQSEVFVPLTGHESPLRNSGPVFCAEWFQLSHAVKTSERKQPFYAHATATPPTSSAARSALAAS